MQKLVWRNAEGTELNLTSGIDGTGNYMITNWQGFSNTSLNVQSQKVPFQDGGVFLDALMEQRELSITLAMQDKNNLETRYQQRRELISALNPKLGEGYLIYTNDFISKRIKCIPQIPLFENHNSDEAGTPKASLSWTACEPYWEDLDETEVVLEKGESANIENNGDIPCQIKATILGSNSPVIFNRSNGKKIMLEGEYLNTLEINTNNGEKEVYEKLPIFKYQRGGVFSDVLYKDYKYCIAGTPSIVIDTVKKETSVMNIGHPAINIIYNNGLYVACCSDGYIMTSSDMINWSATESGVASGFYEMIRAKGLFIVVGVANRYGYIITSPDGITWTRRAEELMVETIIPRHIKEIEISSSDKRIFAYGDKGLLCVSNNGTSWAKRETGVTVFITDCIYSNELNRLFFTCESGVILKSTLVYNFTSQTITDKYLRGIENKNGKLVVVGSGATVATSEDGNTWTLQTVDIPANTILYAITYFKDSFFVISNNLTIKSTDGENWDILEYGGNKLKIEEDVLYLLGGRAVIKTENGENFYYVTAEEYNIIYNIEVVGKKYIIPSTNTNGTVLSSDDNGKTWQTHNTGVNVALNCIRYLQGKYYALGNSGVIVTSEDLENWSVVSSGVTNKLSWIDYGDGVYMIGGNNVILTSTDAENWTQKTFPISLGFIANNVTYFNNGFYVGGKDIVMRTTDYGTTWETVVDYDVDPSHTISWGGENRVFKLDEVLLALGRNVIAFSYNGTYWTPVKIIGVNIPTSNFFGACKISNHYYIVGQKGAICKSVDLKNWVGIKTDGEITLRGIGSNSDSIIVVGDAIEYFDGYENINRISKLTTDSDMTFDLEKGNNDVYFANNLDIGITLSYRQKYIGV